MKVLAVSISERKGIKKHPVEYIELIEDYGIDGDAHAGKWHRQVSLLGRKNIDTGWDINVSGKVFNETKGHKGPKNVSAVSHLDYINSIVEIAILFDRYTIPNTNAKANN